MPLGRFVEALAAGTPAPAGGAACAVVVAVSAGLVAMVARVLGRRSADERWASIARSADELRAATLALADRDVEAYGRVIVARRGPRPDGAAVAAALRGAARVPLAIAGAGLDVLTLCGEIAGAAPPALASDVDAAAALAAAAVQAAAGTARANVAELRDDRACAQAIERELDEIVAQAVVLGERMTERVERRA
jgi:methenyltetrahydrofolate cyclohydrolase